MTCTTTPSVGAYALQLLEPADAAKVEQHLTTCTECREALAEVAPVVPWLERTTPLQPDESAFRRLEAAAAAQVRRRRATQLLAAAAAVAVLVTGAVVITSRHGTSGTTVTASAGEIRAQAVLTGDATGTRILLRLQGVDANERCRLVAVAKDGRREVASTWEARYLTPLSVPGQVSMKPDQIEHLLVETTDGQQLLALR